MSTEQTPIVAESDKTVAAQEKTESEALKIMQDAETENISLGEKLRKIANEHNERTIRAQAQKIFADVLENAAKVGSYKYEMSVDVALSSDLIAYLTKQGLVVEHHSTSFGFFGGSNKHTYVINYSGVPTETTPPAAVETEVAVETAAETAVDSELDTSN